MEVGIFDLKGKKALVTGGGGGVGRACATALAIAGADVAIVGRTRRNGEEVCRSLTEIGVTTCFVQCDVSDHAQIEQMTEEVVARLDRIDIAVNNAGRSGEFAAIDQTPEDWDLTFAVNLSGLFWGAQAQARQMTKQSPIGGKIINIASIYATIAGGNCAYNASKAAIVQLTKSLAAEWGKYNINVNCISPGWMLTPGNIIESSMREQMRKLTPMGSLMRYEDIYGAVVFLASSASDFVTGHNLIIDGGHTTNTWLEPHLRTVPPRSTQQDEEEGLKSDMTGRSAQCATEVLPSAHRTCPRTDE